jgi:hypothetical protein
MNGDSDESEKKLLKEFCNVSKIIAFKKKERKKHYGYILFSIKDRFFSFFLSSISLEKYYKNRNTLV